MESRERSILEQSRLLIFKFGVKSLTMDDIAQQLRVSKKTLYLYFENKNDLVNKVIALTNEEFESNSCIDDYVDHNAIEVILRNLNFVIGMLKHINPVLDFELKKYYPESFVKLEEFKTKKIAARIHSNLEVGIKEGFYRADLNPLIITHLFVAQLTRIMDGETFQKGEFIMPQVVIDLHIYHLRGVCSAKGLSFLEQYLLDNPIKH